MVEIGRVVRPHGIKGELVVRPRAAEHEDIFRTGPMWLVREGDIERVEVTGVRWHKGDVLLAVEGVADRDAAERHRESRVQIPAEQLPKLDPDTYYIDDLIGCRVVDANGNDLGVIDGVLRTGGVDVLEVQDQENRWMLPAASEFILELDPAGGQLTVSLPEGLRDLHC